MNNNIYKVLLACRTLLVIICQSVKRCLTTGHYCLSYLASGSWHLSWIVLDFTVPLFAHFTFLFISFYASSLDQSVYKLFQQTQLQSFV